MNPLAVYGRGMHHAVAVLLGGDAPHEESEVTVDLSEHEKRSRLEKAIHAFQEILSSEGVYESAHQIEALREQGVQGIQNFADRLWNVTSETETQLQLEDVPKTRRKHKDVGVIDTQVVDATSSILTSGVKKFMDKNTKLQTLIEHKFEFLMPHADVCMRGVLDRVDMHVTQTGGEDVLENADVSDVWVTDYKSNVGPKSPLSMARNSLQLRLYALGVEKMLGVMPTHVKIESIEDGRYGVVEVKDLDLQDAQDTVKKVADSIRAGEFTHRASPWTCCFCSFSGVCKHSQYSTIQ